jgi:hypothetical protein
MRPALDKIEKSRLKVLAWRSFWFCEGCEPPALAATRAVVAGNDGERDPYVSVALVHR